MVNARVLMWQGSRLIVCGFILSLLTLNVSHGSGSHHRHGRADICVSPDKSKCKDNHSGGRE